MTDVELREIDEDVADECDRQSQARPKGSGRRVRASTRATTPTSDIFSRETQRPYEPPEKLELGLFRLRRSLPPRF